MFDNLCIFIAQGLPEQTALSKEAIFVLVGLLSLLGGYALILTVISGHRKVFGRNPPLEEDLNRVELNLKGFTSVKEFEALREEARLRAVGLEKQISTARHDFAKEMEGLAKNARADYEETSDHLTKLAEEVVKTRVTIGALDERTKNVAGTVHNFDAKLNTLLARIHS